MTSTKPTSPKTTHADLDAALMSKLAYGGWDQIEKLVAAGTEPGKSIREALGPQKGQRPGESTLTEQQARYMDQRFEVVGVKDFGDDIHAIALRDRETGQVTVAFPGTDHEQPGDKERFDQIIKGEKFAVLEDAKNYVDEIAQEYGPVDVTGHSAGGMVAAEIAHASGPDVVRDAILFQAPRQYEAKVTNEDSVAWREVIPEETEVKNATDRPGTRAHQGEGDLFGGFGTDDDTTTVHDLGKGGVKTGLRGRHSLDNMINTMLRDIASTMPEHSDEAAYVLRLRSQPKPEHPDAPGYDPDSVGYEFGRWRIDGGGVPRDTGSDQGADAKGTKDAQRAKQGHQGIAEAQTMEYRPDGRDPMQHAQALPYYPDPEAEARARQTADIRHDRKDVLGQATRPDGQHGDAARGTGILPGEHDGMGLPVPPVPPVLAPRQGQGGQPDPSDPHGIQANIRKTVEALGQVFGVPKAKQPGDFEQPIKTDAGGPFSRPRDPGAAAATLAELQRRLARPPQAKRTPGSPYTAGTLVKGSDGYGFAKTKAKDTGAEGLGQAAASPDAGAKTTAAKRAIDQAYAQDAASGKSRFDPTAFLKLPLEGLDQDDIRRVMNEPDYWRTSGPTPTFASC